MEMFKDYDSGGFYDEMFGANGTVRDHCAPLLRKFSQLDRQDFLTRKANSEIYFMRQGITFNVYHNDRGTERIFPFDPVPRVITAAEWEHLEAGLTQRIVALNLFLHDVYHDQQILKDQVIPRFYIEEAKHYRPEFRGVDVPADIYIHICGTDLIRGADGEYYVLEDNGRCPSGASYLLENRNALKRAFPAIFDEMGARPVDSYPQDLLNMLHHISPAHDGNPTCVLLTPGCYNSAYFEHCYLAREMGIDIVEGKDLVVVDKFVYMRTTRGLKRVDVIYRRIDDDFIDPVVFRKDSVLGVPGLMNAYRVGNVALANAIGTGVADDKVIYHFVPRMIEYYLGQKPLLRNVPTYLASEENDLAFILDHLPELVVKAANESGGYGMLMGPSATRNEIATFRELITANPRNYIAQPVMALGRQLERSDKTTRFLDIASYLPGGAEAITPGILHWTAILRSCGALGAFRSRSFNGSICARSVVDFLVFSREFPRSIRFCIESADISLHRISGTPRGTFSNDAERETGRLLADLNFGSAADAFASGLHDFLDSLQERFNRIGEAIFETYVLMPERVQVCPHANSRSPSALALWQMQQQQQQ